MKRIAVLGDPMLDVWTDLRSVRPNPEDPDTLVVQYEGSKVQPGGALNVAANLAALGNEVTFFDVTTRGPTDNQRLAEMLAGVGVDYRGFRDFTLGTPITRKERVRLDGSLLYRKDDDCQPRVIPPLKLLDGLPSVFDAFVFVDYGKGSLHPGEIVPALLTTMPDDVLVILDVKPDLHRAFLGWRDCWRKNVVLKANYGEARSVISPDPRAWMDRLEYKVHMVVVTNGAEGAQYCDHRGNAGAAYPTVLLSAHPTVCGAGDVFTAGLTHSLLSCATEFQAVQTAVNHATTLTASGQQETLCLAKEDALFTDPDLTDRLQATR